MIVDWFGWFGWLSVLLLHVCVCGCWFLWLNVLFAWLLVCSIVVGLLVVFGSSFVCLRVCRLNVVRIVVNCVATMSCCVGVVMRSYMILIVVLILCWFVVLLFMIC